MQAKIGNSVMIAGFIGKDAEYKHVGPNNSPKCDFSVKVGERPGKDETEKAEAIWATCVAWYELASLCKHFKKGDHVFAVGTLESWEYQGKTYRNVVIEYASIMSKENSKGSNLEFLPPPPKDFQEIPKYDEDDVPV